MSPSHRDNPASPGTASDAGSAMLIVDLVNGFDFPGGDALMAQTRQALPAMMALRDHYDAAQRPVIYTNDNFGHWHSEFSRVVACCSRPGATGSAIARTAAPLPAHYSILKPRQSAFFMTPLKLLLNELEVTALTVVGIAGDQCILATAMDAHTHGYPLWVPGDAVASITPARNQRALDYLHEVLGARVTDVGTPARA